MASANRLTEVTITQVSDLLEKTIVNVDARRAADLGELATVQAAKLAGLPRERARLAAKLGESDPRVAALGRDIALGQSRVRELRNEQTVAAIDPPNVGTLGWALHGIVLDPDRNPAPGLTVGLYVGENWARQLHYAMTDGNGYFLLQVQDAVKQGGPGPFSIRVLRDGKTVHVEPRLIEVRAGQVEFREIQLSDSDIPPEPPAPGTNPYSNK